VLDQLQDLPHRRALPDDVVDGHQLVDGLAELRVLLAEPPLLQGPLHQVAQLVGVDRLGDVVEGACLRACTAVSTEAKAVIMITASLGIDLLDVLLKLHAVHAGHLDVQQRHVETAVLQEVQGCAAFSAAWTS
jgi:hypothetical protein